MTLASVWAGRPQITELVIVRPVLNLPLQRVREARIRRRSPSRRLRRADGISIEHVSVTGGTIVFSNLRDRVENRIETINADATIDGDRKITVDRQCARRRAAAEIRHQGDRAGAADRAAEHPDRIHDRCARPAAGAAVGQGRSAAQRLGRDDQRPHRHARRRRVQRLGLGRYRQQAAGEARSRFPAARRSRCRRGARRARRSPGAMPRSTLNGLNYVDAQARISAAETQSSATAASRRPRSRPRSPAAC